MPFLHLQNIPLFQQEKARYPRTKKKVFVIGQEESTCTVYGMPKAVATAGLVDQVVKLENVAQEIIMHVGVN